MCPYLSVCVFVSSPTRAISFITNTQLSKFNLFIDLAPAKFVNDARRVYATEALILCLGSYLIV